MFPRAWSLLSGQWNAMGVTYVHPEAEISQKYRTNWYLKDHSCAGNGNKVQWPNGIVWRHYACLWYNASTISVRIELKIRPYCILKSIALCLPQLLPSQCCLQGQTPSISPWPFRTDGNAMTAAEILKPLFRVYSVLLQAKIPSEVNSFLQEGFSTNECQSARKIKTKTWKEKI